MTKRQVKYIGVLAAAIAASACTNVYLDPEKSMQIHLGATVESPIVATKADVNVYEHNSDKELDINLVRWDENDGDKISGRTVLAANMGTPDASTGSWEREISVTPTQFYADQSSSVGFFGWYPAVSDNGIGTLWQKASDGNVIQTGSDGKPFMKFTPDGVTDVMISDFVTGSYTKDLPTIPFKHTQSLYNIYAYAVDEETRDEWGNLNSLKLSNMPDEITITFAEDLVTSVNDITISSSDKNHQVMVKENVSIQLPAGFPSDISTAYLGSVLGGAPTQGVLGIEADTEKTQSGNSVSIARNFKPGYKYNIFLRFSSKGIINAEVSSSKWEYDEDKDYYLDQDFELLTDLSRYGTANSYIVSSANRGYCFTGTVKGNGVNTLTDRSGNVIRLPDTDVNLTDVARVDIVRSDAMMKYENGAWTAMPENQRATTPMIRMISNRLSNGRVMFEVIGETDADGNRIEDNYKLIYKGNVKIAAFDSNDNIIWSWHIWITDKPRHQGYSNGYIALDRNLGAVTTTYSDYQEKSAWTGLCYQFGRKDPMFSDQIDNGQWSLTNMGGRDSEHPAKSESRAASVAVAHAHPMTYYYEAHLWDPYNNAPYGSGEWVADADATNSKHFWGFISVREDIVKTLYDPCPPGYRVPGNSLWENPPAGMTPGRVNNSDETFAGYTFDFSLTTAYYPKTIPIAQGKTQTSDQHTSESGGSIDSDYIYMSSATPYEGNGYDDYAYHFRYNPDQLSSYSSFMAGDPAYYYSERSAAYPVRCVFENSSPVVTDLSEAQTANSYIVDKSGYYEFDATVRGNGVSKLNIVGVTGARDFDGYLGGTDIDENDIARVDIIWWQGDLAAGSDYRNFAYNSRHTQDEINDECPIKILDNGSVVDGKALFYAHVDEESKGNVGIAAYDIDGNILWSWHIWIQPSVGLVKMGDYTIMDRNLGATYAPAAESDISSDNLLTTYGLYYQWGRKDPFFGPAPLNGDGNTYTLPWYEKGVDGQWTRHTSNLTKEKSTIANSVKDPLYIYTDENNSGQSVLWQTTYTSITGQANDLWGYVGAAGTQGNSFAKTMYDPCPPGYRVMQHDVFPSANITTLESTNHHVILNTASSGEGDWNIYRNELGLFLKNTLYSYWFVSKSDASLNNTLINVDDKGIWLPLSGGFDKAGKFSMTNKAKAADDKDTEGYALGRLHTATPYANPNNYIKSREMRWINRYSDDNISWNDEFYIYEDMWTGDNFVIDGRPVRCQME